ncbi:FGGY-family carbohydrate kinase [Serratia nevei]|uniref:FGGY-family carbohydrate kinase n=1 Tax=Serratia nevei TaxID=2703794 RepID=UPI0020A03A2A|nr:FGGY family carbohydrate kinase [Serratia nevei]MCP1103937.1 FGGY-family carbohydrate kinase [Serratia nevei]
MKKQYLMGVDVGTQSAKVTLFDLDGNILCEGRQQLRALDIPAPQLAEHPHDDLWDALKVAFRRAMQRFTDGGGQRHDILAMGICIVRCCRALLQENGELAYPVINWMDKRMNKPYEYVDAYRQVRYVTTTSGYITHRLTGEFKDTCANYIGWWPMDNDSLDWSRDPEAWRRCNLQREQVFEVVKPGEILGQLSAQVAQQIGVPAGIPVVATAHDKAVEALGAGSFGNGVALISLGTYIGAMVHGTANLKNAQNFWPFQASIPGRYLYECMGVRRGMWTVSWFRDQFGAAALSAAHDAGVSIEELLNQEATRVPAGSEGLITVHDWAPPAEAEFRKGAMIGFDGRHTRAHMYRSLLEGIAFTMKNHMDKMAHELKTPFSRLIISGGGANSDLFMQIFADVFGIPTQRNLMNGSAAIGCAINAGMAIGVFDSYEQAAEKLVRAGDSFTPNERNHGLYCRLNQQVYQRLNQHLDPLLRSLSSLMD